MWREGPSETGAEAEEGTDENEAVGGQSQTRTSRRRGDGRTEAQKVSLVLSLPSSVRPVEEAKEKFFAAKAARASCPFCA